MARRFRCANYWSRCKCPSPRIESNREGNGRPGPAVSAGTASAHKRTARCTSARRFVPGLFALAGTAEQPGLVIQVATFAIAHSRILIPSEERRPYVATDAHTSQHVKTRQKGANRHAHSFHRQDHERCRRHRELRGVPIGGAGTHASAT